jgi:glucoamylase
VSRRANVSPGPGAHNEVYWPATGQPQIRDLGFIVAGPSGWFEVKRVNRYQISLPEDCVPLPQVTHQGDRYRLVIEVVPDPRNCFFHSSALMGSSEMA